MAGNDAVFTGNVTDGGDVDWTTEYGSSRRDATPAPVTVSCVFGATGNPTTAATNLASKYTAACPAGSGQSATSTGATVTFIPSDGISGMTVGSSHSPVSSNPNASTPVGNTGLKVYEKQS